MATFVLVHGAGHGAWCWERLTPLLKAQGHDTHTLTLTGVGERFAEVTPDTSLSTHIADVVALIEERGLTDIVLVGHSYGCVVVTGVAGRIPGRISELVFLDGPHPRNGECLADASPGMRDIVGPLVRDVDGVPLCLFPDPPTIAIYGLDEPADLDWAMRYLTPHPWNCFIEPLDLEDEAGMLAIPRTSIDCPRYATQRPAEMGRRSKLATYCREIDTGHDLMITAPDELAAMLAEVARRVEGKAPPKR